MEALLFLVAPPPVPTNANNVHFLHAAVNCAHNAHPAAFFYLSVVRTKKVPMHPANISHDPSGKIIWLLLPFPSSKGKHNFVGAPCLSSVTVLVQQADRQKEKRREDNGDIPALFVLLLSPPSLFQMTFRRAAAEGAAMFT